MYEFVPNETVLPLEVSLRVNSQIVVENLPFTKFFPTLELLNECVSNNSEYMLLSSAFINAMADIPLVHLDAKVFSSSPLDITDIQVVNTINLKKEAKAYTVIMGTELLKSNEVCMVIFNWEIKIKLFLKLNFKI